MTRAGVESAFCKVTYSSEEQGIGGFASGKITVLRDW